MKLWYIKIFAVLGYICWFVMLMGLGAFLESHRYEAWACVIVYVAVFGLPFVWALPLKEPQLLAFNWERGLVIGTAASLCLGLFQATASRDSLSIIVPLIGVVESTVAAACVRNERNGQANT